MNITLTQKDSDYIANIIRYDMESLTTSYNKALKEGNERAELCNKLATILNIDSETEVRKSLAELERTKNDCINNLERDYKELMGKYEKCLELLMIGSQ